MIKIRTCVLCRNKDLKNNLIRIVNINGKPIIDEKYNGRGLYLCNNSVCLKRIINQIDKGKFNNRLKFENLNDFKELLNNLLLKI